jgi:uncharacterized protein (TIGR02453 family)
MNFKNLLDFLSNLSENNNRDWFNDHKKQFVLLKDEFESFIQQLIPKVREIDSSIGPIEAKNCIFRIYRDVRFSKNKDPYKTHFGAYIASGGRKSKTCGYYLHIDPKEAFIAAGAYSPEPQILKEIRYEIMDRTEDFKQLIENKDFKKIYGELSGEKLKTAPKGFPKDFKDLELIKYKSFEVFHRIDEKAILSENFEDFILDTIKLAVPYNRFFNRLIEHILNEERN